MAFLKYALPALAAAQAVFASDCGEGDTIKIENQSDADGYASCKTVKGNIEVNEHYSGDLNLNGIQEIDGSLTVDGAVNMTSLTGSSLESISSTFKLNGLTTLTTLSFGSLTSVDKLSFTALPELQTLDFSKGVSDATSVTITNTGLTSLDGISLKQVETFDITENTQLKTVNVNNLKNATGLINFAGNLNSLQIELPNLSGGQNMTFRNVSSVSIPSLKELSGQLGFWGDSFTSFAAPNLTETGDLVFVDNSKLSNISMPQLKTVNGGFQIARNDKLSSIDFPKLAQVSGAIDFSGEFDEASLPALENVKGGFNMQSTGNFSCDSFKKLHSDKVIRGSFKCEASTSNPTTKDGSSGSSTGSSASTTSEGAAPMNGANMPAMGLAAVFGALLQFL
ncbi:GPI-anchored cell wall organization protein-domain-containing protein [Aspergillus ambiguus]|uniref:GPI-anchored protein Ecm33 n=1 Tax=Aspergillus ambiguus TaxID=176160 RepID=UPI003CCDD6BD